METTRPRTADYVYSGGLNASSDMYLLSGIRGPFTPSQWLELEQQALIYKYITANEPIPLHLLFPIINAFDSAAGFNVFNGGWGPFHLGYSNAAAPDLGRCRRTDGKKWRCAKDAVANHKYCEKHIKRRSRKHVEGQGSDHTKSTTTKVASSSLPPMGFPGNQINSSNMDAYVNRMQDNGDGLRDATELSFLPQATNQNHKHALDTFADWPNSQNADQLSNLCCGLQSHSPYDSTQLSNVSMSTTSSPTSEHLSIRQATNWMNISPEASMGGPLGEALQISNSTGESRKRSALSLMPSGLD